MTGGLTVVASVLFALPPICHKQQRIASNPAGESFHPGMYTLHSMRIIKFQNVPIGIMHRKCVFAPWLLARCTLNRKSCLLQMLVQPIHIRCAELYMRGPIFQEPQQPFASGEQGKLAGAMHYYFDARDHLV